MAKQRGLGRGLDALLSLDEEMESNSIKEIDIDKIEVGINQPRQTFNKESLQELAVSIKEHGILQPLLVRPQGDCFEIVAGERRWRAAKLAGLTQVPAVVKEMDDLSAAEISLIENIQRDDLSIIEEARAYKKLVDTYGYTQETIGDKIGKSRSHVTNCLRILSLPDRILEMLDKKILTAGHARALLTLTSDQQRLKAAEEIAAENLTVRETEKMVKRKGRRRARVTKTNLQIKPVEIVDLEEKMEQQLGTRVQIVTQSKGGKIEISYYSDEDLERILEIIMPA
ncbi:MAG: ParB/RepB/Spo0J family partition protein [Syntrophomonadaceae bacterium]